MPSTATAPRPVDSARKRARIESRDTRLRTLGFDSYRAYLKSPEWASVKARYRASELPQECLCGETDGLHVHHLTYERVGEEALEDLTVLCPGCHAIIHALEARGEVGIDLTGLANPVRGAANRAARQAAKRKLDRDVRADRDQRLAEIRERLTLAQRIQLVSAEARRQGKSIRSPMRVIERTLQRIEEKLF